MKYELSWNSVVWDNGVLCQECQNVRGIYPILARSLQMSFLSTYPWCSATQHNARVPDLLIPR